MVPAHVGFGGAPGEGNTTSARRPRRVARVPAGSPAAPAGWRPGARPRAPLRAAAPAARARSSAIPRSLAPRTRPPVPQGPSRPPWRLSMIRCRVAKGCHGGRRRVGRSCSQSWGKSLKQRKTWPSWTVGSRGNEPRPRGGDRVTGGGPSVKPQARPPRFHAERDVGGSPPKPALPRNPARRHRLLRVSILERRQPLEDISRGRPTAPDAFSPERIGSFSNPRRCRPGLGASAPVWASRWVRSGAAWLPSLARFQTLRRIC